MRRTRSVRDTPVKRRIFIVDGHPLVRQGLIALIESDPDLAVCGEASTFAAALQGIEHTTPDLVIVDVGLEGGDGLELVKDMKVHHPKIPALVLSMHDESLYAERAFRAGASGYVTKQGMSETVLSAIHHVLNGESDVTTSARCRTDRMSHHR